MNSKAEFLMSLMEKFEVCFELQHQQQQDDQPQTSFWERTSVITAYLPEQPLDKEFNANVWPEECPVKMNQLRREYKFNIIPKELVSRLLVRLHPKMEAKSLWRTGLYLESSSSGEKKVQVLILARLLVNELEVSVRGAEVAVTRNILGIVGNEISVVSENCAGITMSHEESSENFGELDKGRKTSHEQKYWEFEVSENENWEIRSLGSSSLKILSIVKGGVSVESELCDKLKGAVESLGGNLSRVNDAFAIANPHSLAVFNGHRVLLSTQHTLTPLLFKKEYLSS